MQNEDKNPLVPVNMEVPAEAGIGRIRRWMLRILGMIWLIAGLLQMQPTMFTVDTVTNVMQPTLAGDPAWLSALEHAVIGWVTPGIAWFNFGFAAIQILIAVAILMERPWTVRLGLWLSVGWGVCVWFFGEGLGGVLTGSASMLGGGPGAVILYVWLAVVLLLPQDRWRVDGRRSLVGDGVVILWFWAALQQAIPGYWTRLGLSSVFQNNASMQPHGFAALLYPMVAFTAHFPVLCNAVFVAVPLAVAWFTYARRRWAFWLGWGYLAFVWVFGEGFGMVLTPGMATDLNSAPLWALLMLPGWWAAARAPARVAAPRIRRAVMAARWTR